MSLLFRHAEEPGGGIAPAQVVAVVPEPLANIFDIDRPVDEVQLSNTLVKKRSNPIETSVAGITTL